MYKGVGLREYTFDNGRRYSLLNIRVRGQPRTVQQLLLAPPVLLAHVLASAS